MEKNTNNKKAFWSRFRLEQKRLIRDTLKKYDEKIGRIRYSNTSLTMFSAWVIACGSYLYDQYKNGFRYEAWLVLVGVALGSKISHSISEKIKK